MGRWFDHLRGVLERHGGRVQKFVGDAVVAVFGIPVVNEDDALRAVRAAAGLGGGLGPLNAELERDWGVTLQTRTGVNTGEVVTGDPAIGDALVLGDAVNVAARRLGAGGRRALGRGDLPAASKLLERAVGLLPAGDPGGQELLVELADVCVATGEFPRATQLLGQVAAAADDHGDERLAAHARVGRLRMQVGVASDLDAVALQTQTGQAVATFAAYEDQRGLAKTWGLLAALGFLRCRIAEAEAAAGQAITHARLARDDPAESWARGMLAQGAFWGPVPAPEGIRRCQELLEQAAGNRRSELTALQSLAGLQAMDGRPGAALATVGQTLALAGDIGENRVASLAREFAASALAMAGELAAAEEQLRVGIRVLERLGESGMRSNMTVDLAHVLHRLGRPEEALRVAMAGRAIAATDDLFTQVRWRGGAARSLALQGRAAEAERLAAEAVELARPTDMLTMRGDALLDQAAVAAAAGRPEDADRGPALTG